MKVRVPFDSECVNRDRYGYRIFDFNLIFSPAINKPAAININQNFKSHRTIDRTGVALRARVSRK